MQNGHPYITGCQPCQRTPSRSCDSGTAKAKYHRRARGDRGERRAAWDVGPTDL